PEPLVDVERAVGIDVDPPIDRAAAQPVPPYRHHAADREEGRVDGVALADIIEHRVIGEVDIAGMVDGGAAAGDDVAERDRRVALAPAPVIVAGADRGDREVSDGE